jgi:uncharacterized membrane protein
MKSFSKSDARVKSMKESLEVENQRNKVEEFLWSVWMGAFFGSVIYFNIYLLLLPLIHNFFWNTLLFVVYFLTAASIWNKADPYKELGFFHPLSLLSRVPGLIVFVLLWLVFG